MISLQSNAHVPHRFRDFQRAFRMPLPDESLSVSRSSADAEVTVTVGTASEQKEIRTSIMDMACTGGSGCAHLLRHDDAQANAPVNALQSPS